MIRGQGVSCQPMRTQHFILFSSVLRCSTREGMPGGTRKRRAHRPDPSGRLRRAQERECMPMSTTLSERIDHLFRTQLSPRGREYTYREVAAAVTGRNGTTCSPSYLWQLRTGAQNTPPSRHGGARPCFFEVSPSYFFDDELTEFPDADIRQLVASRNETVRQMTVTLLGLSDESLNAVLNLACRLRTLEGLPSPD